MTTVLFISRRENLKEWLRVHKGYELAFSKHDIKLIGLDYADGARLDIHTIIDRLVEKPAFIIHPDIGFLLPEGLSEIGVPTVCFHIDTFVATRVRIGVSMLFDYAIVFHPGFDRMFRQEGHPRPILLPHAANVELFQPTHEDRIYEVGWVGRTDRPIYASRRYLLPRLAQRFKMNKWEEFHTPEEMAEVYQHSQIVVNISRDDYPQDANLRVFEAMAAGALLITGIPSELSALGFQDREHFAGYRDNDEVEDLIHYYLSHEAERLRIAKTGKDLVLREHTHDRRVEQILTTLRKDEGQLFAPARRWSQAQVRRTYLVHYAQLHLLDRAFGEWRSLRQISLWAALKSIPTILREIMWQFRIRFRLRDRIVHGIQNERPHRYEHQS